MAGSRLACIDDLQVKDAGGRDRVALRQGGQVLRGLRWRRQHAQARQFQ
jgi:hypothetical protein